MSLRAPGSDSPGRPATASTLNDERLEQSGNGDSDGDPVAKHLREGTSLADSPLAERPEES